LIIGYLPGDRRNRIGCVEGEKAIVRLSLT